MTTTILIVINASKSSIMVVTTKQRDTFNNLLNIDVCFGADSLDQSNCIDYIGVKLDAHLTWNSQIDAVCKKLELICVPRPIYMECPSSRY